MAACPYVSAALCLVANNMFNPDHMNIEYDECLAETSFSFLGDMIQQVPYEGLIQTKASCGNLLQQARAVRLRTSSQIPAYA